MISLIIARISPAFAETSEAAPAPAVAFSGIPSAFGLTETKCGFGPVISTLARHFPENIGLVPAKAPPSIVKLVTSDAIPASKAPATLGRRSLPSEVAPANT